MLERLPLLGCRSHHYKSENKYFKSLQIVPHKRWSHKFKIVALYGNVCVHEGCSKHKTKRMVLAPSVPKREAENLSDLLRDIAESDFGADKTRSAFISQLYDEKTELKREIDEKTAKDVEYDLEREYEKLDSLERSLRVID